MMPDQSLTRSKLGSAEGTTDATLVLLKELAGRRTGAPVSVRPAIEPPIPPPAISPPPVSDSMWPAVIAGCLIIALFFGGFGAWAMTAPLNGAVVANGFVKVETNRKSVQHLDGGIVKELRVKEGDR